MRLKHQFDVIWVIAAWDHRDVWRDDGSRSAGARHSRETSTSVATGKAEVRRARQLGDIPHTATALAEGALSPDHVDLLGRANSQSRSSFFTDHEDVLVEQCKVLRYGDAYRMVEYWRHHADAAAGEDEAARQHDTRTASTATTLDGMVDVRAWLDPVGGPP